MKKLILPIVLATVAFGVGFAAKIETSKAADLGHTTDRVTQSIVIPDAPKPKEETKPVDTKPTITEDNKEEAESSPAPVVEPVEAQIPPETTTPAPSADSEPMVVARDRYGNPTITSQTF